MGRAWRKEFDADVDHLCCLADDATLRRNLERYKAYPPRDYREKLEAFIVMDIVDGSASLELKRALVRFAAKWKLNLLSRVSDVAKS